MKICGEEFAPGTPFDKTLVPTRKLRQLFEGHRIKFADVDKPGHGERSMLEPRLVQPMAVPAAEPVNMPPVHAGTVTENQPVDIPSNWRDLTWQERRSIASKISDFPIKNGGDADAAIELELERREGQGDQ
ncbi:hypothetical protein [Brucella endophytica]|uniref:hypothetical protein n=1 Tax=Brucella endophytica TaxID=1963359 RepID=UPI0035BC3FB1